MNSPESAKERCPTCKSPDVAERWCMSWHWDVTFTPHRVGATLTGCVLCLNPIHGAAPLPQPTAPPETFASRSEEKRIRSMRGDPNPLDPRPVAQTIEAEQSREEFEKWMAAEYDSIRLGRDPESGLYFSNHADRMWDTWQAAAAFSAHQKAELTQTLRNLLAVIHRDGGHYAAEHGLDKASLDAEKVVIQTRAELASLREVLMKLS